MFKLIFLAAFCAALATTTACSCRGATFRQSYRQSSTDSVVRVLVEKVEAPCGDMCDPIEDQDEEQTFTLKLIRVFKGCGPPTKTFFAKSVIGSSLCGVTLVPGNEYMLNLPTATVSTGTPLRFYNIFLCQFNREWDGLRRKERRFLRRQSRKPRFMCV